MSPSTCNAFVGLNVPIPTFPSLPFKIIYPSSPEPTPAPPCNSTLPPLKLPLVAIFALLAEIANFLPAVLPPGWLIPIAWSCELPSIISPPIVILSVIKASSVDSRCSAVNVVIASTLPNDAVEVKLELMFPLAVMWLNVGLPAVPKLVKSIVVDVDALFILILAWVEWAAILAI